MPHRAVITRRSVVQPRPLGTDSSISPEPQRLILVATRPGRNAREGYADIGVNMLSPQTYSAGALLANTAKIAEIYPDSVLLERGTQRTRLYVQGHEPPGSKFTVSSLELVGGTSPPRPLAVADSHDTLTDFIRVTPIFDGASLRALEVYANARSDGFARLGLQPGDRITAIEHAPLQDSKSAVAALRRLTLGAALSVTVERNGGPKTLSLDGSMLTAERAGAAGGT